MISCLLLVTAVMVTAVTKSNGLISKLARKLISSASQKWEGMKENIHRTFYVGG